MSRVIGRGRYATETYPQASSAGGVGPPGPPGPPGPAGLNEYGIADVPAFATDGGGAPRITLGTVTSPTGLIVSGTDSFGDYLEVTKAGIYLVTCNLGSGGASPITLQISDANTNTTRAISAPPTSCPSVTALALCAAGDRFGFTAVSPGPDIAAGAPGILVLKIA